GDGARFRDPRWHASHRRPAAEGPGHRDAALRGRGWGGRMNHRGPARFFGHGLPYADTDNLRGMLITIEGTDGVGRSTQVRLLKEWLEVQGYGVIETGWTRSELM